MKPGKHQRSKQRCQDLCWRFSTLHNLLFCPHTLCMNYVTNTFLLVGSSISSKQLLCFVQGQGQKTELNNIQQRALKSFKTIPLY